jgi:hypothetical protein
MKAIVIAVVLITGLSPAMAQVKFKTPAQIQQDIDNALKKANAGVQKQVATATATVDPAAALPCDFALLISLTPQNLMPTVKACLSDVNSTLVSDTQRALASAKAYSSSGDNDAVNCLTPALAIFQAGVQIPAVPAVAEVPATATTPAVPAVAAIPAQDPGPILLYQKYREFTLAGALTSCQAWFNGPINATAAAGIAGAGTAIAGAALLAPK